jgi:3-dehydroquinate synthase
MKKDVYELKVKLGRRSYAIKIGEGILTKTGIYLSGLGIGKMGIIITNPKIKRLYGDILLSSLIKMGINCHILTVPDSEVSKSYKVVSNILGRIANLDDGKRPFIVAFGGGVVGDLAGFIAAVYRRGVFFVQIPTTLVAQVDSSIGGKVAIDLPIAKNLVGAFYQPKIVIADISLLKTLPKREVKCGLSEIIKYSIISSRELFNFVFQNITSIKKLHRNIIRYVIRRCCTIKSSIVSNDEKDTKGIRVILNYGHTIGHAIEAASGYKGIYNHGEAIAIGMIGAAIISNKMGMLSRRDLTDIKAIISKAGLPNKVQRHRSSKIFEALCHDKKFIHGVNRFVLPIKIGKVKLVENIPKKVILEAIEEITC